MSDETEDTIETLELADLTFVREEGEAWIEVRIPDDCGPYSLFLSRDEARALIEWLQQQLPHMQVAPKSPRFVEVNDELRAAVEKMARATDERW